MPETGGGWSLRLRRAVGRLNPKPKTRGKPQIPQISQMTATKDFGVIRRKNASETKM
jgi:hypothetical protein